MKGKREKLFNKMCEGMCRVREEIIGPQHEVTKETAVVLSICNAVEELIPDIAA